MKFFGKKGGTGRSMKGGGFQCDSEAMPAPEATPKPTPTSTATTTTDTTTTPTTTTADEPTPTPAPQQREDPPQPTIEPPEAEPQDDTASVGSGDSGDAPNHTEEMEQAGLEVNAEDPGDVFEVLSKLGEGAYGSVYKCRKKDDDSIKAVKVVPIDADFEGMVNEINILKECKSPYIVDYDGCYEKDGDLWMVMEYMSVGSVADMVEDCGEFTEPQIAVVCESMLRGLQYLHSKKKIHRDIKAGNVLIDGTGEIKLADFGVSAQLKHTLTKRNTVIGSPFWMAPEVIGEETYNGLADIWSLAITAIEMAEGEPPYFNVHPMRAVFLIPKNDPPTLKDQEKWSPAFHDFLKVCLNKDVKERPTASQLLEHGFIKGATQSAAFKEMVETYVEIKRQNEEAESEEGSDSDEESSDENEADKANNIRVIAPGKVQKNKKVDPLISSQKSFKENSDSGNRKGSDEKKKGPSEDTSEEAADASRLWEAARLQPNNNNPNLNTTNNNTSSALDNKRRSRGRSDWASDLWGAMEVIESGLNANVRASLDLGATANRKALAAAVKAEEVRGGIASARITHKERTGTAGRPRSTTTGTGRITKPTVAASRQRSAASPNNPRRVNAARAAAGVEAGVGVSYAKPNRAGGAGKFQNRLQQRQAPPRAGPTGRKVGRTGSIREASRAPSVGGRSASGGVDPIAAADELIAALSSQLKKGGSSGPPPPLAASGSAEVKGITVYENDNEAGNVIGEVIISSQTSVAELCEMIVSELGKPEGFSIKKNKIPISKAQYSHKAIEFFRSDAESCVIVPCE